MGGAKVAANADVSERCLKKHGRWKSESSKDGYILDSTEKRLNTAFGIRVAFSSRPPFFVYFLSRTAGYRQIDICVLVVYCCFFSIDNTNIFPRFAIV